MKGLSIYRFLPNSLWVIGIVLLSQVTTAVAQEKWTLQKCIEQAIQNNPQAIQAQLDINIAELNNQEQVRSRYPNLSAFSNWGNQFGRTIDPTTNSFDNQQISFNSLGFNANINLFSGGRIKHRIANTTHLLEGAQYLKDQQLYQLKLDVLAAYLTVLLSDEQLQLVQRNLGLLQEQEKLIAKEVVAGTKSYTEQMEIQAQIAQQEQSVTTSRYQLELAYADLKNSIFLEPEQSFVLQRPQDFAVNPTTDNPQQVYQAVLQNHPALSAQNANIKAAESGVKISRSFLYPSLFLFGAMNTNYSSVARRIDGFRTITNEQTVRFMGNEGVLAFEDQQAVFVDNPYFSQLEENFGQQFGLQLNIPIYSRGVNRLDIQRQEVELVRAKSSYEQIRRNLLNEVQRAMIDAKGAWETYQASTKNVQINKKLLDKKARELDLGATTALDYFTVRNALEQAEIQHIRSKYDYLFKTQIIELYKTGQLTL